MKLFEFFTYASLISYRFSYEYIPALVSEQDKLLRLKKAELVKEMKSLVELYSAYQLDYDYFDHKNASTFSLFIVRDIYKV
jgi:hypothetical protein